MSDKLRLIATTAALLVSGWIGHGIGSSDRQAADAHQRHGHQSPGRHHLRRSQHWPVQHGFTILARRFDRRAVGVQNRDRGDGTNEDFEGHAEGASRSMFLGTERSEQEIA